MGIVAITVLLVNKRWVVLKYLILTLSLFFFVAELPIYYGGEYKKNSFWLKGKDEYFEGGYDNVETVKDPVIGH